MNEKGFGVMSIKKEVIAEFRVRAKEEKTTLSDLLSGLLQQSYSNKEEKDYSNDIATAVKEYSNSTATQINELKEELKKPSYSNVIATDEKESLHAAINALRNDMPSIVGEAVKSEIEKARY